MQLAPEGFVVEPTLMVIGLNHHTAPLAMRERFWIGETKRYEALRRLKSAEGVEEVVVLCTCRRTEFLLWADEPTLAANSILQFLGSEHGLKLSEWQHFYRLLDDMALTHIFRVTTGLDSLLLCEAQILPQVKSAWEQAKAVGATGPFLNSTLQAALEISEKVRNETTIGELTVCLPTAAFEVSRQVFGTLKDRRILLVGANELSEMAARRMMANGAWPVTVIDQSPARAQELAEKLGATAAGLGDRWKCMLNADVVISSTGCPHVVLTHEEAARIAEERNRVALVIIDIGMPRDVDPEVRRVDGILLYDMEGLENSIEGRVSERTKAAIEAERMVAQAAHAFRSKLQAQSRVPTIVALRQRLEEICRQEVDSFMDERGPFTREQDQSLHAITAQLIQKIASSLVRELKEIPEKEEQERMTGMVQRLFRLGPPNQALAGTRSVGVDDEPREKRAVAINY